ncbi:hypothetical protein WDU94_014777 [Cyamophila willieti]
MGICYDRVEGSISNIDDTDYHCNKTQVRKVISGVVGAASSVTSIQVANLLRLFKIPQVSFFSTSPELSNKQRFEYFTRTIPSDHYQVKAMVEIVKKLKWSYVSIIYEESNYGIKFQIIRVDTNFSSRGEYFEKSNRHRHQQRGMAMRVDTMHARNTGTF